MLFLVPSPVAQALHETNARLRFWLDGLIADHGRPGGATPEQMTGLLSELMRAGEWLRTVPRDRDSDLAHELSEYRRNVERLHELLPAIHASLLRERAQLESERARLGSIAQWTRGSRQTL